MDGARGGGGQVIGPVASDERRLVERGVSFGKCAVLYAAVASFYLLFFYLFSLGRGTLTDEPTVWAFQFDQAQYWRSASAFFRGDLAATEHWYPLAYPLLLAPLSGIGQGWDTLIINLVLYLLTLEGFLQVAARLGVTRPVGAALFATSTMWPPHIAKSWIYPWTTTLSAAVIWGAWALTASLLEKKADQYSWKVFLLGALLALIPCTRPGDIFVALPIGLTAAAVLVLRDRDWRSLALMIGGSGAVLLPYGALWIAIWGPSTSPYMVLASGIGFNLPWLGWKAYLILIDPRPWYPHGTYELAGLVKVAPWLLLGAAGGLSILASSRKRVLGLLLLVPTFIYLVLTLTYVDLIPSGMWFLRNVHYFKWLFPLFALLALHFLLNFRASPMWHGAILALVLAISCVRFTPVLVGPHDPARLVVYNNNDPRYFRTYFADSVLTDRRGTMRNIYEYRSVPDGNRGIYAIALRRDFMGEESISAFSGPPSGLSKIGNAGTTEARNAAVASFGPVKARYQARVSFGLPCWWPSFQCPDLPATERRQT